ncbi:MAG: glycosyltransferase family 2 protein [Promethearchaeota archaeon]
MKVPKKVFIVIPARNEEKSIARTLDAITTQTHPPEKVIVVDDGSRDNTLQVLQNYTTPSFQLLVQQRPHRKNGVSLVGTPALATTFNVGFNIAKNYQFDYIMIVGADIILEKRYIEKMLLEFKKDSTLAIASGQNIQMVTNPTHARGAGRLIDSRFWKFYGEKYPVIYGWEDDCLVQSRRMGFKVKNFPKVRFYSMRKPQGTIDYLNWGRAVRAMKYPFIVAVLRAIRLWLLQHRGIKASIRFLAGYYSSPIPEHLSAAQQLNREFMRRYQLRKIPEKLFQILKKLK